MAVGSGEFKYERLDGWGELPPGFTFAPYLWTPLDMATDSQDRVYVFSTGNHPLIILDREGKFITCWGEGHFKTPHGIYIGSDDSLYLVDCQAHKVEKYTLDGRLLMTLDSGREFWPAQGTQKGLPFNLPTNATVTPSGEIVVSDGYGNSRVHRFSADGELINSWGEYGNGPGQFRLPHGVDTDKDGNVYVIDREPNHRIQVFSPEGSYITEWKTGLDFPKDLHIDRENGILYLVEGEARADIPRVSIRHLTGEIITEWRGRESRGEGLLEDPHGICVDTHGDIYISENQPVPRMVKFVKV